MDLLNGILGLQTEYETWDKQNSLPLYIAGSYEFQAAILNDCKCIILTPTGELPTLPALKKQFKRIQEVENVPVVLNLSAVSLYRRKNLIENRIPFLTNRQVYLPFIGTYLEKETDNPREVRKFMFSTQQLVLLYLYNKEKKFFVSNALGILPFTAMTLSRAVKQLEMVGLFTVTKEGVNKVIEAKYNRKELFEKIKIYLSTPVRAAGYMEIEKQTTNMVIAGEAALAEKTMLNQGRVKTYAVYAKGFNKKLLMNELVDPDKQIRIELWEYDPKQFSDDNMADDLSLALSFLDNEDERIEEAIEELLDRVWGE